MYFVTVVNFLSQLIFISPLFLGKVMYANEFQTNEKQKLTEIKINCNIYTFSTLISFLLKLTSSFAPQTTRMPP